MTTFIDNSTVIQAIWLNGVDRAVTQAIGDGINSPTTAAEVKTNLSLNNVDNTSDVNKPISAATQSALDLKQDGATATFAFRNMLINSDFRINQRMYVSAATLAAGVYGHDRWKAGASGGDYSFTQLSTSTQITIASGKSVIQVVEDKNVVGGSYVLSWTGTAQARVGVDSATPSGSYVSSPVLITGQTTGVTMSVEFNTGTLSKVQLEAGSVATPFEHRPYGTELALCQRYAFALTSGAASSRELIAHGYCVTTLHRFRVIFPVTMRTTPTIVFVSGSDSNLITDLPGTPTTNYIVENGSPSQINLTRTITGGVAGAAGHLRVNDVSNVIWMTSSEL